MSPESYPHLSNQNNHPTQGMNPQVEDYKNFDRSIFNQPVSFDTGSVEDTQAFLYGNPTLDIDGMLVNSQMTQNSHSQPMAPYGWAGPTHGQGFGPAAVPVNVGDSFARNRDMALANAGLSNQASFFEAKDVQSAAISTDRSPNLYGTFGNINKGNTTPYPGSAQHSTDATTQSNTWAFQDRRDNTNYSSSSYQGRLAYNDSVFQVGHDHGFRSTAQSPGDVADNQFLSSRPFEANMPQSRMHQDQAFEKVVYMPANLDMDDRRWQPAQMVLLPNKMPKTDSIAAAEIGRLNHRKKKDHKQRSDNQIYIETSSTTLHSAAAAKPFR